MRFPSRAIAVTLVSAVAVAGLVLVVANPFDWFLDRSERFTIDGFLAIEPGMQITEVVDRLGDPIRTTPLGSFHHCEGCTAYYFLGNPPDWLIMFREAWVVVDADGKVTERILLEEP